MNGEKLRVVVAEAFWTLRNDTYRSEGAYYCSCEESLAHKHNNSGKNNKIKTPVIIFRLKLPKIKRKTATHALCIIAFETKKMEGTYTFVANQKWDQQANPPSWQPVTGITGKPYAFHFLSNPPQRHRDHSNYSRQQYHTSRRRTNIQRETHPVKRAWPPRVWVEWGTLRRRTVLGLYGRICRVNSFWIRSACNIKAPRTPHQSVEVTLQ